MELIAQLSCLHADDVLQWSQTSLLDGQLVFQRRDKTVTLAYDGGRIVEASSDDPNALFGRHLFSQGLVGEEDLAAAEASAGRRRFGAALVELGVLTRTQVRAALAEHTLNLACSVVFWSDGIVSAQSVKLRPIAEIEPDPLDPFFAVMEAARRQDELDRLRTFLPHDNVELDFADLAERDRLQPAARRLLEVFAAGDTVGRLYDKVGGSKFHFLKAVEELVTEAALRTVAVGPPPPEPASRPASLLDVLVDQDLERRLRA